MSKLETAVNLFIEAISESIGSLLNFDEITYVDMFYYGLSFMYVIYVLALFTRGGYFIALEYKFRYPSKKEQFSW